MEENLKDIYIRPSLRVRNVSGNILQLNSKKRNTIDKDNDPLYIIIIAYFILYWLMVIIIHELFNIFKPDF